MGKNKEITLENFHAFLDWLDSDKEKACIEYENIRQRLTTHFSSRNFLHNEQLADETINRVILKLDEIKKTYFGNKHNYFYGVARNVLREYQRSEITFQDISSLENVLTSENKESDEIACLRSCLEKFEKQDKELLLDYYSETLKAKSELRKKIANELKISLRALRIKVFKLKNKLEICVKKCLE